MLVLMLLALGAHTPLFRLLYDWVPGFARFRGMSKFTWQAELFLVVLAAGGLDRLLRARQVDGRFVAGVFVAVGVLLARRAWIVCSGLAGTYAACAGNGRMVPEASRLRAA